jgi:hypothetical protein
VASGDKEEAAKAEQESCLLSCGANTSGTSIKSGVPPAGFWSDLWRSAMFDDTLYTEECARVPLNLLL